MKTGSGDELWSAIADPSRRRVLDLLVHGGEPTASSLAHEVPFTRQAVTKHLAGLEDAGLITRHREAAKSSSASTRTGSTRRHRPWRSSPPNGTDGSRRSNGSPKPRTETRRTLMNDSDNTTGYHSHMLVDAPGPAPDRRVNDPRVNDLNAAFL
jgi:hypothetical protein